MWHMCKSISGLEEDNICVQNLLIPAQTIYDYVQCTVLYCSHCTVCTQVDFTARRQEKLSVFS